MSSPEESDIQNLRRLLREEKQARQQAEQARQQAEQDKQQAQQDKQQAQQAIQKTTFNEFLQACHETYHIPVRVETIKSWTTQGFTNPAKKYYPKLLREWEDFSEQQGEMFSKVRDIFHPKGQPAPRLFSPMIGIEEQGRLHCNVKIANEASLRNYEKVAIEVQVADIINRLSEVVEDPNQFQLGQGIVFENDPNSLNDIAEEVQDRLHIQLPRTPSPIAQPSDSSDVETDSSPKLGRNRADQYCIYRNEGDNRELLFIVEYKPPHKLSIGNLVGFRDMDLKKDVIDRKDIPKPIPSETDEAPAQDEQECIARRAAITARLQYTADKVATAVATQTFHYMIENGLEYSYITTGQAFIFLHIKKNDPTTLYYHVTVPSDEISNDGSGFPFWQTAIGQVMNLCLMAFKSDQRDHQWRKAAMNQLEKYPFRSIESIQLETPASERALAAKKKYTSKSPLYRGRKVPVTSNYNLRSKCNPDDLLPNLDDDHDDPDGPSSPARPRAGNSRKNQQKPPSKQKDGVGSSSNLTKSSQGTQRQYCTQKCLLGIARGLSLDRNCPNLWLHPRRGKRHAVDQSQFTKLVQNQLANNLDKDCEPLGLQGARGALFRLTLASHGYVFVGKGTVRAFVPDLLHEGRMYEVMTKLQGTAVPVYLGNIKLLEKYYLDVGVRILHMLLMSWGGDLASIKDSPTLQKEIDRTVAEVERIGVDQMDVREPNLLWNRETQRVMLIDFERATMMKRDVREQAVHKERAMQEISPNKKRKQIWSPGRKRGPRT